MVHVWVREGFRPDARSTRVPFYPMEMWFQCHAEGCGGWPMLAPHGCQIRSPHAARRLHRVVHVRDGRYVTLCSSDYFPRLLCRRIHAPYLPEFLSLPDCFPNKPRLGTDQPDTSNPVHLLLHLTMFHNAVRRRALFTPRPASVC